MKEKKTVTIVGMHCASCAASIEHALSKKEGVLAASVNFATEKLTTEFESSKVAFSEIEGLVGGLGYGIAESDKDSSTSGVIKLKRRFIFSLLLGLPLFYLVMGEMIGLPVPKIPLRVNIIFQFLVTSLIMLVNADIYVSGLKKLIQRNPNMDSLVETGTLAAYFYSLAMAVVVWFNPQMMEAPHCYFESAAFI
ncbi:MAG: cation transporter, partial [Patescibacteria group bacterium]